MLASAACYSPVPLLLAAAGGAQSPFLFNGIYRLGALLTALAFMGTRHRELLARPDVRQALRRRLLRPDAPLLIAPYLAWTATAWSARFVDISVTTIVQETWPALFILLTERLLRHEGRFRRPTPAQLALVALAFTGLALVVQSQGDAGGTHQDASNATLGVALAAVSALLAASTAYNFRWATELRDMIPGEQQTRSLELFCLMAAFSIGTTASAALNIGLGLAAAPAGAPDHPARLLGGALAGGLLLDTTGTLLNRTANLTTQDLGINTIGYATPLMALGLLQAWGRVGVERPGMLALGALAIVGGNLLIALEARTQRKQGENH